MNKLLAPAMLLYPVVLHITILAGRANWAVYLFSFLLLLQVFKLLKSSRAVSWPVVLMVAFAAALTGVVSRFPEQALKLIPLVIFSALFTLFARTLVAGGEPLITRIARKMEGQALSPETAIYTRRVTVAWAMFFAVMFIVSAILAVAAPIEPWSLFTNIVSYALVLLMFVVEFQIRKRIPGRSPMSFLQFLQRLRGLADAGLWRLDK